MPQTSFAVPPELDPITGAHEPANTYTLSHTGAVWVLLTRHHGGTAPVWSTPLARHGASPDAPCRVAQAVAVRLLHELGVEVTGWIPEQAQPRGHDGNTVTLTDAIASPRATTRRLRGLRGH